MPEYIHDCCGCTFLETSKVNYSRTVDWYYCYGKMSGGTVLGRYGDDPQDYWSTDVDIISTNLDKAKNGGYWAKAIELYHKHNLAIALDGGVNMPVYTSREFSDREGVTVEAPNMEIAEEKLAEVSEEHGVTFILTGRVDHNDSKPDTSS